MRYLHFTLLLRLQIIIIRLFDTLWFSYCDRHSIDCTAFFFVETCYPVIQFKKHVFVIIPNFKSLTKSQLPKYLAFSFTFPCRFCPTNLVECMTNNNNNKKYPRHRSLFKNFLECKKKELWVFFIRFPALNNF